MMFVSYSMHHLQVILMWLISIL